METMHVEIVTPEQLLATETVDMVVLPGVDGDFAVAHGHSALIAALRPGLVIFYKNGVHIKRLFIDQGISEITPTMCRILVSQAVDLNNLTAGDLDQKIKDLKDEIKVSQNKEEQEILTHKLTFVESQLVSLSNTIY
ncbi:MAG: ATP synthase F1 subunit epsilon [Alphaproteobacteria bacterium]|nr:ATP synthase F1 subunit epsilon [Alphaproteobacteria bacterium]